jgi:hypothetical protein
MSASNTNTQTASTASIQTVAIVPSDIAGNPYYFQSEERFVEEVMAEVQSLANETGSITDLIVRGSHEIAQILDKHTTNGLDVDSFSMDFRMFLDDEAFDGEGSGANSVQTVIGDGLPIADIVADVHDLSDSEQAQFDLTDRDDRDLIDADVLDKLEEPEEDEEATVNGPEPTQGQARIGRAKAKSKARAMEMIVDDYYDYVPTADHAIILEDGTDAYQQAGNDVRGHHNWSKYPSSCDGEIRMVSLSSGEGGALNWTHALLVRDQIEEDSLTDNQLQRLRDTLDKDTFEALGLEADYEADSDEAVSEPAVEPESAVEPEPASRPPGEATAVAGESAD